MSRLNAAGTVARTREPCIGAGTASWICTEGGKTRAVPWAENTMVLVFSTTKGLAAVAVAHAMSAGLFSADDLVADLWPQFGPAYPPISAHMRLQRFVDGPPEPDRS